MATACPPSPFKVKATAPKSGGDLCPPGNYPGVLFAIVDLGWQEDSRDGKVEQTRQICFAWELPGEVKPDGSPFVLLKRFNLFFSPKSNLRKLVEGWRGKPFADDEEFDLEVLVGKGCLVNVTNGKAKGSGRDYHDVESVKAVPKGMTVPKAHHAPFLYSADMGDPPPQIDDLPWLFGEPLRDVIARGKPAPAATNGHSHGAPQPVGAGAPADDDDIPF